jgi:hypothetical protein
VGQQVHPQKKMTIKEAADGQQQVVQMGPSWQALVGQQVHPQRKMSIKEAADEQQQVVQMGP